MYFFLKYIVTLFYKELRIKIVVCLLRESGPCFIMWARILYILILSIESYLLINTFKKKTVLNRNHKFQTKQHFKQQMFII